MKVLRPVLILLAAIALWFERRFSWFFTNGYKQEHPEAKTGGRVKATKNPLDLHRFN